MAAADFYTTNDRGVLLRVKAKAHARDDGVLGARAGELLISVRAAAEKGKANAEIVRVIAKALGIPRDSVSLKSGAAAPHKVFQLPPEAADALRRLAGSGPAATGR